MPNPITRCIVVPSSFRFQSLSKRMPMRQHIPTHPRRIYLDSVKEYPSMHRNNVFLYKNHVTNPQKRCSHKYSVFPRALFFLIVIPPISFGSPRQEHIFPQDRTDKVSPSTDTTLVFVFWKSFSRIDIQGRSVSFH